MPRSSHSSRIDHPKNIGRGIQVIKAPFPRADLAALPCAALLEMHWFKLTYFHEGALLFPQRCYQGHGAANAASHGNQFSRGWQRRLCAALLGGDRW